MGDDKPGEISIRSHVRGGKFKNITASCYRRMRILLG